MAGGAGAGCTRYTVTNDPSIANRPQRRRGDCARLLGGVPSMPATRGSAALVSVLGRAAGRETATFGYKD